MTDLKIPSLSWLMYNMMYNEHITSEECGVKRFFIAL